ncbi:MAG: hypothetical protein PHY42_02305 [Bacilli bacterium]|nr:hypothetical protein [Bacilli bacterium]
MNPEENLNETPLETEETLEISEEQKLAIALQEVEVLMEEVENKANEMSIDERNAILEEYMALKAKAKDIRKQMKVLKKTHKTVYDKIPVWMYLYAIIQLILYFPFLSSMLWINFSSWLITIFNAPLNDITNNAPTFFYNTILFLLVYALPLLGFFTSWIIDTYATRSPFNRKTFRYIWIGQTILMIGMGLWIYFTFLKDVLR